MTTQDSKPPTKQIKAFLSEHGDYHFSFEHYSGDTCYNVCLSNGQDVFWGYDSGDETEMLVATLEDYIGRVNRYNGKGWGGCRMNTLVKAYDWLNELSGSKSDWRKDLADYIQKTIDTLKLHDYISLDRKE